MTEPLIIEHEGRPTHVVLPYAEWQRLRRRLAEVEDAEAVGRAEGEEDVPLEVAERLWAGEHPLRVWREHRGLTQAALARCAGIAQPTIARIETGARHGTVVQMQRLARALEVSLDALAGWRAEPRA